MRAVVVLLLLCVAIAAVDAACSGTVSGVKYDLSSLVKKAGGQDYEQSDSQNQKYFWNFCENVVSSPCGTSSLAYQTDSLERAGSCKSAAAAGPGQWGTWKDASTGAEKGITILWTGGAACSKEGASRQFQVNLKCDKTATTAKVTSPVDEAAYCHYVVEVASAQACAGAGPGPSDGLSGGWVFIIVLTVGFSMYCALGMVFMIKKKDMHGVEAIPQYEFWRDLPSLLKDGVKFTVAKVTGKGSSGSYENVA